MAEAITDVSYTGMKSLVPRTAAVLIDPMYPPSNHSPLNFIVTVTGSFTNQIGGVSRYFYANSQLNLYMNGG